MSEDKEEKEENLDEERKKLNNLGVRSTWNILTDLTKKKKEE
ncbi:MAG: hypothetical protein ACFE85_02435 [Candidatus Hodarchaeota archaeon]